MDIQKFSRLFLKIAVVLVGVLLLVIVSVYFSYNVTRNTHVAEEKPVQPVGLQPATKTGNHLIGKEFCPPLEDYDVTKLPELVPLQPGQVVKHPTLGILAANRLDVSFVSKPSSLGVYKFLRDNGVKMTAYREFFYSATLEVCGNPSPEDTLAAVELLKDSPFVKDVSIELLAGDL